MDNFRFTRLPQHTDARRLKALLQEEHPGLEKCHVYVAGPDPLVGPLGRMLKEVRGERDTNIRLLAVD